MMQFPTSGVPGTPTSQGNTAPVQNSGYAMYSQAPNFPTPPAFGYTGAPNMLQITNPSANALPTNANQGMQGSGNNQLPTVPQMGRGTAGQIGANHDASGNENKKRLFQQLVPFFYEKNMMTKEEAESLMRRAQDVKGEDLMVYLKDAVGNEKLDVALRVLASEQQRKVSSMPPQDGFTQRGTMAGISQAGMQQQQISQVQVQSLGAMRRQIPQNVNSTRDFGRQVPAAQRQEAANRHGNLAGLNPSYPGTGQSPHVIGVASSGPAVGTPLSMGMTPSGRLQQAHPSFSGPYQTPSTVHTLPGSVGIPGSGQSGVHGSMVQNQYQRLVPMNAEWNHSVVPGKVTKDTMLQPYTASGSSQPNPAWGQQRASSAGPNGHAFMLQQPYTNASNIHPTKSLDPQVGDKRPATTLVDSAHKRTAIDASHSKGPRPKHRRPIEDPNAPDANEGDVIRGAAIELADEQEALLGHFKTVRQSEPDLNMKGVAGAACIKSWVNRSAVENRLSSVLRQNGLLEMSSDCVEAMVRGIELEFEGMIKKVVTAARHRKPVAEGQRGIHVTSDIRGKLREARQAEAEKQATKERAERAKLEKLAETASQTATKKELAGNKELAAKVEKVKRERILSAEAAAANRAVSMAFGGLGFEKYRKKKREKEAAEKAREEERVRIVREREAAAAAAAAVEAAAAAAAAEAGRKTSNSERLTQSTNSDLFSNKQVDADLGARGSERSEIKIQVKDLLSVLSREPHYAYSIGLQKLHLRKR